jgi:hypothetical protein
MCLRLAYPNGEARDEVIAIRSSGNRICFEGKMGGTRRAPVVLLRGADTKRYTRPVIAANADWMVLRKTGYVKRAFEGPCVVVVRRSWRYAQLRLQLSALSHRMNSVKLTN